MCSSDLKAIKVVWSQSAGVGSNYPIMMDYSSVRQCDSATSLSVSATSVYYQLTQTTTLYPPLLSADWPLVVWLGDEVILTDWARGAAVKVDIVAGSPGGPSSAGGDVRSWSAPSVGSYYIVDVAMDGRSKRLEVVPVDSRQLSVYYAPSLAGDSFTLSGAVSGAGSPDVIAVVGDTLAFTRLSGSAGMVLMQSYDAKSGAYVALSGPGVVGQSTAMVAQASVTWATAGWTPGQYWYGSPTPGFAVRPGRILLYATGGGAQCVQCVEGEYCFNGQAVTCPVNSRSPLGSNKIGRAHV